MSQGNVLSISYALEDLGECCTCGVPVYAPKNRARTFREKGTSFYCVNGHSMSFTESENARLTRELAQAKEATRVAEAKAERARADAEAEKARAERERARQKRLAKRVANGVCPCCRRSFQNLQRHMKTKHPAFPGGGLALVGAGGGTGAEAEAKKAKRS